MVQDYYKILGVSKEASFKEIRKAYHTLALKLHPDKNPEIPSPHQRFAEINNAYETLKDPKKRAIYDRKYSEANREFGSFAEDEEFEAFDEFTEIIIYVTQCGVAYIFTMAKSLMMPLYLNARTKALDQFEKLKDKGADILNRVEDKVSEKCQDVKRIGKDLFDQAKHKAQGQFEKLKDKGADILNRVEDKVNEKS